ncbi:hypothetical protein ABUT97_09995, partial [Escherichia coli]|uniref:hypothetical protein n=1 Tax=Escherichia coli TaxID=562 RepID=UPI00335F48B6
SSGAGRTSDGNGSHASTLKSPSYTKSVSWQHYRCGFKNLLFKKLIVHIVTSQYKQWREHRYLSLLAVLCMESVIG